MALIYMDFLLDLFLEHDSRPLQELFSLKRCTGYPASILILERGRRCDCADIAICRPLNLGMASRSDLKPALVTGLQYREHAPEICVR